MLQENETMPMHSHMGCSYGMVMANRLSEMRGLLEADIVHRAETILMKVIDIRIDLKSYPIEEFIAAMHRDKKTNRQWYYSSTYD